MWPVWAELCDEWAAERPVAPRDGGMLAGSDGRILPGASDGMCPGVGQWWEEPAAASALGGGGAAAACEGWPAAGWDPI